MIHPYRPRISNVRGPSLVKFALLSLVLGFCSWLPLRAQDNLVRDGFVWNAKDRTLEAVSDQAKKITDLSPIRPYFDQLQPHRLILSECKQLKNVDGLKGLKSLEYLDLSSCYNLESVIGLQALENLQGLSLYDCYLDNLKDLHGVSNLRYLDLRYCAAIIKLDGLRGMAHLKKLECANCIMLENAEDLKGNAALEYLNFSNCPLQNVNFLKEMTRLEILNLSGCRFLKDIYGLEGLDQLKELSLHACSKKLNLEKIRGLISLENLDLSDTEALENADVMQGLSKLKKLNLSGCTSLKDIAGLGSLSNLQVLDLSNCASLGDVEVLNKLKTLRRVDLRGCGKITESMLNSLKKNLPDALILAADDSEEETRPMSDATSLQGIESYINKTLGKEISFKRIFKTKSENQGIFIYRLDPLGTTLVILIYLQNKDPKDSSWICTLKKYIDGVDVSQLKVEYDPSDNLIILSVKGKQIFACDADNI